MAKNLVLYAVENGARRPLLSLEPGDKFAAAKIHFATSRVYAEATQRGVEFPEMRAVVEERESDESARFVIRAQFQEVDSLLEPVGKPCGTLAELFAAKKPDVSVVEQPEAIRSRELSQ